MDWKHSDPEQLEYWEPEPKHFSRTWWFFLGVFIEAVVTLLFKYFFY